MATRSCFLRNVIAATVMLAGCGAGLGDPPPADAQASPHPHPHPHADAEAPDGGTAPDFAPATTGWVLLDDFEGQGRGSIPVFWSVHTGTTPLSPGEAPTAATEPPRGGSSLSARLTGGQVSGGADMNVHHHFDWSRPFSAVRFWARSGTAGPAEVIVALTEISPPAGYFPALRAGRPWLARRVSVGPEWREHVVELDLLAPEGPGTPTPVFGPAGQGGGTELHFIVPEDRAYDLWLDDVYLRCREGAPPVAPCTD